MEQDQIFLRDKGIWLRFIKMLFKAKLPILWIAAYVALSMLLTNVGVNVTEYTAEMFAGNLSFQGVILPFILYSVVNLVFAAISFALSYLCYARIDRNLRRMVWDKITRLPMSYFDKNPPRELITRITSDTTVIGTLIIQVIIPLATGIYSLYVLFRKIAQYDDRLMLSLLAVVPFIIAVGFMVGRMRFGINDASVKRAAELTKEISEKTASLSLVKSFAAEDKEYERGVKFMKAYYKTSIRSSWIGNLTSPIYVIVGVLQTVLIVLIGRGFYSDGSLTLTQWIAYLAFAQQIAASLQGYAGYWVSFKASQGSTRRVTYIMDEKEEAPGPDRSAQDMSGSFQFHDVSFAYDEKPVLQHVNLVIPEGKTVALVGMSGGGKTTMFNLLERFYEPQEGRITVGGEDIASYNLRSYREAIGYITQETTLLSGTIRENLLYGVKREVGEEELLDACRKADAYDFIMDMPGGLDASVGENGSRLSGGQKQRIAIARALLRKPRYLFMDEATGAMDARSREKIWTGLGELMAGKTTVMIAHDYQTARHADVVVVVANGMVEDMGTKEEMYARNEFFRQFADAEEAEA